MPRVRSQSAVLADKRKIETSSKALATILLSSVERRMPEATVEAMAYAIIETVARVEFGDRRIAIAPTTEEYKHALIWHLKKRNITATRDTLDALAGLADALVRAGDIMAEDEP